MTECDNKEQSTIIRAINIDVSQAQNKSYASISNSYRLILYDV
jgi:hypothetical protein